MSEYSVLSNTADKPAKCLKHWIGIWTRKLADGERGGKPIWQDHKRQSAKQC